MDFRNTALIILDSVRFDYFRENAECLQKIPNQLYENAYSTSSWTLPSITSMVTGKMPSEHRASRETFIGKETFKALPRPRDSVMERFSKKGFFTGLVTDNPYSCKFFGFDGFQYYFNSEVRDLEFSLWEKADLRLYAQNKSELLFKKLYQNLGEKFFAFVHLMETHHPHYSPKVNYLFRRECDAIQRAKENLGEEIGAKDMQVVKNCYSESIGYLDRVVAKNVERLLDLNAEVFVLADHGQELWEQGWYGIGYSLRDSVLRVPFLRFSPERVEFEAVKEPFSLKNVYLLMQGLKAPKERPKAELYYPKPDWTMENAKKAFGKKHVESVKGIPGFQRRQI
jgi:glucan phosphoethanolaminetransferase (alkaline phosphatase superfamily)